MTENIMDFSYYSLKKEISFENFILMAAGNFYAIPELLEDSLIEELNGEKIMDYAYDGKSYVVLTNYYREIDLNSIC